MRETGPITTRAGGVLAAVGLLAFGAAAAIAIFGDGLADHIVKPSAYSRSAIGHRALLDHLERAQDRPVVTVRRGSPETAQQSSLYILAEPGSTSLLESALSWAEYADSMMITPPKWMGRRDFERPDWLYDAAPSHLADPVLSILNPDASFVRPEGDVAWRMRDGLPAPTIQNPQLIDGWAFDEVLVSSPEGVLAGITTQWDGVRTLVVSDPDLFSNHGLDEGENAALITALMTQTASGRGAIVFDETIHGFAQELSIWRRLFSFPYVIIAIGALIALAGAVWAALTRFGPTILKAREQLGGRMVLIQSAASLTQSAGHGVEAFRRYGDALLRQAANQLRPPRSLSDASLTAWLDDVTEARGLTTFTKHRQRIAAVTTDAEAHALAQDIHHWVLELDDGYERGRGAG